MDGDQTGTAGKRGATKVEVSPEFLRENKEAIARMVNVEDIGESAVEFAELLQSLQKKARTTLG